MDISEDQHVIYHGGELPEQSAYLLIDLRQHIGIVVLANAQAVDVAGIAREVLGIVRDAVR